MAGTVTIGGAAEGLTSGSKTIGPLTIVGAAIVGEVDDVVLVVGDNTVVVPATATAVVIVPPASYGGSLTVRTVNGDTGIYVSPKYPCVVPFDPAHLPSSLILHASATGTAELTFI